jgi:hypothetical protein
MKVTPPTGRTAAWRRIASLAGDPSAPPGSEPAPDCCEPGEIPPDRAADGADAVTLTVGGAPSLVQTGSFGNTSTLTNPTTPGNTLVAIGYDRSGGDGGPPAPSVGGYTLRGRAEGSTGILSIRSVAIWTKVADGTETSVTGGSFDTFYSLTEWTGEYAGIVETQDEVPATTALDTGGATTPTAGIPSVLIGAAVMATGDASSDSVTPDSGVTEIVDDITGGFSPLKWAAYRSVPNPTTSYTVSGVATGAYIFGGVTIVLQGTDPTWSLAAPLAVDGNDSTYETITGTDLLRVDLGAAFRIVRTRIRIAGTTSGARVITIKGANVADLSDEVTLDTIAFTATGGLTAQDVTGLWDTDTAYRYFELSIGTSDTYRVHSWELYEQTPGTIIVTNPADDDSVDELQPVLDAIYDAINSPTMRWEAVTDGEDVFVWVGDDLVHEFKEYV